MEWTNPHEKIGNLAFCVPGCHDDSDCPVAEKCDNATTTCVPRRCPDAFPLCFSYEITAEEYQIE